MRILVAATMLLLLAPAVRGEGAGAPVAAVDVPDDRYVHELEALLPSQVEAKKIDELPELKESKRINVRGHMRSASFGYRVSIIVPIRHGHMMHQFYVEHSPSTNHPQNSYYGPFKLP